MKSLRERFIEPLQRLLERPLPAPTEHEQALIDELRIQMSQVDVSHIDAEAEWLDNMSQLERLVASEDPRQFLRWKSIRRAMFVANAPYIRQELAGLKQRSDWSTRWEAALEEDSIGAPTPSDAHPGSSGNRIHLTYDVAAFEQISDVHINDFPVVFEFGGGYGGMCRQFERLGSDAKYIIFDLPHFSALQQYYLKSLGRSIVGVSDFADAGPRSVCCVSNPDDARQLVSSLSDDCRLRSLFIATWSFSECQISLRESFQDIVDAFGHTWIGFQDRFHETDNLTWFDEFMRERNAQNWIRKPIEHIPGNFYLTGTPQSRKAEAA